MRKFLQNFKNSYRIFPIKCYFWFFFVISGKFIDKKANLTENSILKNDKEMSKKEYAVLK